MTVTITTEDDVFGEEQFVVTVSFGEGDDLHFTFRTSRIASAFAEQIALPRINHGLMNRMSLGVLTCPSGDLTCEVFWLNWPDDMPSYMLTVSDEDGDHNSWFQDLSAVANQVATTFMFMGGLECRDTILTDPFGVFLMLRHPTEGDA